MRSQRRIYSNIRCGVFTIIIFTFARRRTGLDNAGPGRRFRKSGRIFELKISYENRRYMRPFSTRDGVTLMTIERHGPVVRRIHPVIFTNVGSFV